MDEIILQVRHYGLNIFQVRHYGWNLFSSEALWMEIRESVYVIRYFACHIAWRGISDGKNFGEALSRVKGLYKGIPHYLPKIKFSVGLVVGQST